jgi:hypothetical protein
MSPFQSFFLSISFERIRWADRRGEREKVYLKDKPSNYRQHEIYVAARRVPLSRLLGALSEQYHHSLHSNRSGFMS